MYPSGGELAFRHGVGAARTWDAGGVASLGTGARGRHTGRRGGGGRLRPWGTDGRELASMGRGGGAPTGPAPAVTRRVDSKARPLPAARTGRAVGPHCAQGPSDGGGRRGGGGAVPREGRLCFTGKQNISRNYSELSHVLHENGAPCMAGRMLARRPARGNETWRGCGQLADGAVGPRGHSPGTREAREVEAGVARGSGRPGLFDVAGGHSD